MRMLKNSRGIALVAIIMMMMILLTISSAGLLMSGVNLKTTSNYKTATTAFNVADAGLNHGWMALGLVFDTLHDPISNPLTLINNANFTFAGKTGTYTVQAAELSGLTPKQVLVTATGCFPAATFPCSSTSKAVIEARFRAGPFPFNYAIESVGDAEIEDTEVAGGSVVNSYDSSVGAYNACLNPPSCTQRNVGSEADIRSNEDIKISGTNTVINGNAIAADEITTSGGATINGTETEEAPKKDYADVPNCAGSPPTYSSLQGITGGATLDSNGNLSAPQHSSITIAPGTYCFNTIQLDAHSTVTVNGAVKIYLSGNADFTGGTIINTSCDTACDPQNLQIFSSSTDTNGGIKVTGGNQTAMTIYAPEARVKISGGSDFFGAVVGQKVDVSGGTNFHYDKKLRNPNGSPLQLISWRQVF